MGVRSIRGGLAVLGVVVLVGAGVAAASRLTAGPSSAAVMHSLAPPAAGGSASAGGPAAPPPCGPGSPVGSPPPAIVVPDSVMLTPADVDGAPVVVLAAELVRPARLFSPLRCRDVGYLSDAYRAGERAVSADVTDVDGGSTWNGIAQYVAVYRSDGAGDAMADLRSMVAAPDPTRCWADLGPVGAGDESVMLKCASVSGYAGELVEEQFAAVVRVGRAIVMVVGMVTGRQPASGGAQARVRTLALTAADRARAIA